MLDGVRLHGDSATTDISLQTETACQWWRLTTNFGKLEEINTSVSILGTIDNVYLRGIWSDAKGPTDENVVQAMTSFRRGL